MDQTSWNLQKETQRKQEKLNRIKLWNVTEWSSSHWSEHKSWQIKLGSWRDWFLLESMTMLDELNQSWLILWPFHNSFHIFPIRYVPQSKPRSIWMRIASKRNRNFCVLRSCETEQWSSRPDEHLLFWNLDKRGKTVLTINNALTLNTEKRMANILKK